MFILENQFIYFIAIIDPLTNYGFKKQVSKMLRTHSMMVHVLLKCLIVILMIFFIFSRLQKLQKRSNMEAMLMVSSLS